MMVTALRGFLTNLWKRTPDMAQRALKIQVSGEIGKLEEARLELWEIAELDLWSTYGRRF